jgi:hypothetical protein
MIGWPNGPEKGLSGSPIFFRRDLNAAELLSKDEARRIAVNIARLPELVFKRCQ